jgi:hypothetical protein
MMTQPRAISKRVVKFAIALLTTAGLVSLLSLVPMPFDQSHESQWLAPLGRRPAIAQQIPSEADPGQQVYQLIPDLPLENQYINARTGEPSPNNTLVSRLIRYHVYIKSRPPNYRLDWKLTMADYLGANDWLRAELYPGWDTLTVNPMEGDVAVIRSLNRAQRDTLVNVMVSIFSSAGGSASPANSPGGAEGTNPTPSSTGDSPTILQPRPGDAQLLLP